MQIAPSIYFYPFTSMRENNCNTVVIDGPEKIIIDPGHKHLWPDLKRRIEADGFKIEDFKMVVHTHCHPDHIEAGGLLELDYGVPQAMHRLEAEFLEGKGRDFFPWMGLDHPDGSIDRLLEEGPLDLGDKTIYIYHTPGHSPGGICLHWPEGGLLVTGDLIFAHGVGRTDFDGGDHAALVASIRRMEKLPGVEILLPGHGPAVLGADKIAANYKMIEMYF